MIITHDCVFEKTMNIVLSVVQEHSIFDASFGIHYCQSLIDMYPPVIQPVSITVSVLY